MVDVNFTQYDELNDFVLAAFQAEAQRLGLDPSMAVIRLRDRVNELGRAADSVSEFSETFGRVLATA